jgi:ribosomal protein L9
MPSSVDIVQHYVVNYLYKRGTERDASQKKKEVLKTQTNQIKQTTQLSKTNSQRDEQPQP